MYNVGIKVEYAHGTDVIAANKQNGLWNESGIQCITFIALLGISGSLYFCLIFEINWIFHEI